MAEQSTVLGAGKNVVSLFLFTGASINTLQFISVKESFKVIILWGLDYLKVDTIHKSIHFIICWKGIEDYQYLYIVETFGKAYDT